MSDSVKLTKTSVDNAKPRAERYIVWDRDLRGFGLRVEPSGTKTYLVRYRLGAGGRRAKQREFKIGKVGEELTPDEARKLARTKLAEVVTGSDPQGAKARARAEDTVAQFCDRYAEDNPAGKKASTVAIDTLRFKNHIKPEIGSLRLSEVRRDDIDRLMRTIRAGKVQGRKKKSGGDAAAARTIGLLQGVFGYAVQLGILAANPAQGVARPKDKRKERFLTSAEIERLFDTLAEMSAADFGAGTRTEGAVVTKQHADILRLLLLTGARKNEIARLKWAEVDLHTNFLRLGDSKTGQKEIALGAAAQTIFAGLARGSSPWIFPSPNDPERPVANLDWAWVTIRKRAKLDGVRIHDLRHSFASIGLSRGLSLPFIGKLLGHRSVATTARYAHLERSALQEAADLIGAQIGGSAAGVSADVSQMKAGAA